MADHKPGVQQQGSAERDAYVAAGDQNFHQYFPAEPAPTRAGWNVPARNPRFTGREELLTAVRESLLAGGRTAVQALRGMGGVGKTQIAIEYAHRWGDAYELVWWVDSDSPIGEQIAMLGADLGCVNPGMGTGAARRAVLAALRERGRWLLIFDNAEEPAGVAKWLPGGTGHVLITSRAPGWEAIALTVDVDVLDRPDSVALLQSWVRGLEQSEAEHVASTVGDLPLAIAQAAGYMATTGVLAGEYTRLLRDRPAGILSDCRPCSYPQSLAAVTAVSLGQLQDDDPAAAELAVMLAFLAPEPVPIGWFVGAAGKLPPSLSERAAEPLAWRQVLAALGRTALARVDRGSLVMHRLTQAIIRDCLSGDYSMAMRDRASTILIANAPGDSTRPDSWNGWAVAFPHILTLILGASGSPDMREMADRAAWYLIHRGDAQAAYALARDLYEQRLRYLGVNDGDTMRAGQTLAESLRGVRRFEEARKLDSANVQACRQLLGADHIDTLTATNNLAIDLRLLGNLEAARELDDDTLTRCRSRLGEDHPETLRSACSLACDLYELGEINAGRKLEEDTLARRRRVLGENHPETLRSANNLASALLELGEHKIAVQLYQDTLQRKRRVLGEGHPSTAITAGNLVLAMVPSEPRRLKGVTSDQGRAVFEDDRDVRPGLVNGALKLNRPRWFKAKRSSLPEDPTHIFARLECHGGRGQTSLDFLERRVLLAWPPSARNENQID